MHRRSSYAAVAAGNSAASPTPASPRPDSFPHSAAPSSGAYAASPPGLYPYPHSLDIDGLNAVPSLNPSWGRLSAEPLPTQLLQQPSNVRRRAPSARSPSPFFVPSYLRGSLCAVKAKRNYEEWKAKHPDVAVAHGLDRSTQAGHRAARLPPMSNDVVERYQFVNEDNHAQPWPAEWSTSAKHKNLEIVNGGRGVRQMQPAAYVGNSNQEEGVAVRAAVAAPPQAGLYYYEIEIKQG